MRFDTDVESIWQKLHIFALLQMFHFFFFCVLQRIETHTHADINMQAWEDGR